MRYSCFNADAMAVVARKKGFSKSRRYTSAIIPPANTHTTGRRKILTYYHSYAAIILCVQSSLLVSFTAAFSPSSAVSSPSTRAIPQRRTRRVHPRHARTRLYNLFPNDEDDENLDDDEVDDTKYDAATSAQLRKAKKLLNDAKKKQSEALKKAEAAAARAELGGDAVVEESKEKLPFFATKSFTASAVDSARKIKSKTDTGEIIADGETMATLSKSEPWEVRSLDQMFAQEARVDFDGNLVEEEDTSSKLAERDMAASIYNLRKELQNADFRAVFDARNRFIGEVD